MGSTLSESTIANGEMATALDEWDRFQHRIDNGHSEYVDKARRNYRYWRGDGGQWTDGDRAYMESVQGRKCIEINEIQPAVQTAVGEQIATRADIAFAPAQGAASAETAVALSKVAKHILTQNGYHRVEKQAFKDGLVKRRGYFDVRLDFEGNIDGDVRIVNCDPISVIPDMNARGYDPHDWGEVIRFDWMSLDEIEGKYGKEARKSAEVNSQAYHDNPYSDVFAGVNHIDNRFGFGTDRAGYVEFERNDAGERRLRVLERQFYKYSMSLCYIDPKTGDVEPVSSSESPMAAKEYAEANGLLLQKHNMRRVRWRVCTRFSVLHDDWSPYRSYTIIPFFYLFDYGDTLSMVDAGIGPQDLLNKSLSSELHILTSTSNSGWMIPNKGGNKSALVGMTTRDLKEQGMKTGLVLEYDPAIGTPQKILPNKLPTGMDRLADRGEAYVKSTTGMNDAEQGLDSNEISGVAIQSKHFQAKLQQADPHDNMEHTRKLLALKILELVQDFFTAERTYKIIGKDGKTGEATEELVSINKVDPVGNIINDVSVGTYDVAVTSKPTAATYEEGEFKQVMAMREKGIPIPDDEVVRLSNLTDKYDLATRMSSATDPGVMQAQQAIIERTENAKIGKMNAETELLLARRKREVAGAANTNIQAMFGAANAGRVIATTPGVAPLADEMLTSSGFEDANSPPAISDPMPPAAAAMTPAVDQQIVKNTSPNFPPQADAGVTAGIEGGA